MDEAKITELIARGRVTGALTFEEVSAAFADVIEPEQLAVLFDRFEAAEIVLIAGGDDEEYHPPPVIVPQPRRVPAGVDEVPMWPVFYRNPAFEERLRGLGVPVEKSLYAFATPEQIATARLLLPGDQALRAWLRLRELADEIGFRAFINAEKVSCYEWDDAEVAGTNPILDVAGTHFAEARQRIAEADAIPPLPWQFRNAKHKQEPPPAPEFTDEVLPVSLANLDELFSPEGPYRCLRHTFGPPDCPIVQQAEIVLVPTSVPWQVFAYHPFGGWNFCPWPDEQLSMLREWHRRYGAEVVSRGFDRYELFVPNPPRTRSDAELLGREIQYFAEEYPFERPMRDDSDWVEAARTVHYWTFWWD